MSEQKLCPVCSLPMNFQVNKTNEKAPDWKCSDKNCKFQWDKNLKIYVKSNYVTGVWNPSKGPRTRGQEVATSQAEIEQGEKIIEGLRAIYKLLDERLPK